MNLAYGMPDIIVFGIINGIHSAGQWVLQIPEDLVTYDDDDMLTIYMV